MDHSWAVFVKLVGMPPRVVTFESRIAAVLWASRVAKRIDPGAWPGADVEPIDAQLEVWQDTLEPMDFLHVYEIKSERSVAYEVRKWIDCAC